ncbi:hypothetical protein B5J93_06430 [Moraxella equi]|uniref:Uncharacterized protein n=1 Tax=Moraxella equi TaxID=60442 RepID=A0ABX3NHT2_9GAMM|nr:hypothetical protein B5J93_06430 [Moraxella equi]
MPDAVVFCVHAEIPPKPHAKADKIHRQIRPPSKNRPSDKKPVKLIAKHAKNTIKICVPTSPKGLCTHSAISSQKLLAPTKSVKAMEISHTKARVTKNRAINRRTAGGRALIRAFLGSWSVIILADKGAIIKNFKNNCTQNLAIHPKTLYNARPTFRYLFLNKLAKRFIGWSANL